MTTAQEVDILLVEDTASDAELALRVLERYRLANRVEIATDGEQALERIFGPGDGRKPPRIILLDLKLPKIDGLEVLRRIKNDPRSRPIPVVVISSSREEEDLRECYRLGANSYIVKPIRFEEFNRAIANLGCYWLLLNEPLPPDGWPAAGCPDEEE